LYSEDEFGSSEDAFGDKDRGIVQGDVFMHATTSGLFASVRDRHVAARSDG
jgi:hypothetical protein